MSAKESALSISIAPFRLIRMGAPAYAQLAPVTTIWPAVANRSFSQSKAAALKALELDEGLSEPHMSMGSFLRTTRRAGRARNGY